VKIDERLESVDDEGYTVCGTYTVIDYLDDEAVERCNSCWAPVLRD
jgi:hypothetical protein